MKQSAIRFILYVFILTAVCALLQLVWNRQVAPAMQLKSGFLLLGIFAVVVTLVHLVLLKAASDSPQLFVQGFMIATFTKLLIYLLVFICFIGFSTENKKVVVVYFLFYYFVFSIFEVSRLFADLRKIK